MAGKQSYAVAVLTVIVMGLLVAPSLAEDSCPEATECLKNDKELRQKLQQKDAAVSALEEQIKKLQSDLAAVESQRAAAETQLSAAQADVTTAKAEVSTLQEKLSSTSKDLSAAEARLTQAQTDMQAASSCYLSLQMAETRISQQASKLQKLKALEDALLPLWLSNRLAQAQEFTAEQWKVLKKADLPGKASAAAAPYVKQAAELVDPYWQQVMEATAPARETAGVYVKQAQDALDKLPIRDTVAAARQQAAVIEAELQQTLRSFIATQPALSSLDDPVILQLLVHAVLGLPLLMLLVVLLSLLGGARGAGQQGAGAKAKKTSGGSSKKEVAATPARATRAATTRRAVKA